MEIYRAELNATCRDTLKNKNAEANWHFKCLSVRMFERDAQTATVN